jgi:hypothetical protein
VFCLRESFIKMCIYFISCQHTSTELNYIMQQQKQNSAFQHQAKHRNNQSEEKIIMWKGFKQILIYTVQIQRTNMTSIC